MYRSWIVEWYCMPAYPSWDECHSFTLLLWTRNNVMSSVSNCQFKCVLRMQTQVLASMVQSLSQDLETGCPELAIVEILGVQILRGATIYSDFHHKHVLIHQNKAWYGYTISLESYGDDKIQLYAWDWHFKKFLTKDFGCPEGCFFSVFGAQKDTCEDALLAKTMAWCLDIVCTLKISKRHPSGHPIISFEVFGKLSIWII